MHLKDCCENVHQLGSLQTIRRCAYNVVALIVNLRDNLYLMNLKQPVQIWHDIIDIHIIVIYNHFANINCRKKNRSDDRFIKRTPN